MNDSIGHTKYSELCPEEYLDPQQTVETEAEPVPMVPL